MRRISALVALLILTSACATYDPTPPTPLADFNDVVEIDAVWSHNLSAAGEDLRLGLRPAMDARHVYLADHKGVVVALERDSGDVVWEFDSWDFAWWGESRYVPFSGGPSVGEGLVVAGSLKGDVYAFDSASGEQRWHVNVGSEVLAPPAIGNGAVVLRVLDGRVIALNVDDGSQRWFSQREMPTLTLRGISAPVIVDNTVIAGFDNGRIVAYTLDSGETLWEAPIAVPSGGSVLDELVDVDGAVVNYRNDIYSVAYHGTVTAIALESGSVLWRVENISSIATPALDASDIYVTDADGVLRAYSRLSGRVDWDQAILKYREVGAPAVYQDWVVVGDLDGYLHFFNRTTGELEGRESHDGEPIRLAPTSDDDLLLVQSEDGDVVAYRVVRNQAE